MKLWRRHEPQLERVRSVRGQPEPDRAEAWAEVLGHHRTRPSRAVKLERYHSEARRRQEQAKAATLETPPPPEKIDEHSEGETSSPPAINSDLSDLEQRLSLLDSLSPDAPQPGQTQTGIAEPTSEAELSRLKTELSQRLGGARL